jgi:hypothetical protein
MTRSQVRDREDLPHDYWRLPAPPISVGTDVFRLVAYVDRGQPLYIDGVIESLTWEDAEEILKGTATIRRPEDMSVEDFPVKQGNLVACQWAASPNDQYRELWRMRLDEPAYSYREDTVEMQLADEMTRLSRSDDDFVYKKSKKRPKGWRASEIVRDICRRYEVKVGYLAPTLGYVTNLVMTDASPLDAIRKAYKIEAAAGSDTGDTSGTDPAGSDVPATGDAKGKGAKDKDATTTPPEPATADEEPSDTGLETPNLGELGKYVITFESGALTIKPLVRSAELLKIGDALIDAALSEKTKPDFATAYTVTGTFKDGTRKRKKQTVKVQSTRLRNQYGYIHRKIEVQEAKTLRAARLEGEDLLEENAEPDQELTLTHPGIPTLRRGHAIDISLPENNLRQIVYLADVRHSMSAGTYDMEMTAIFEDPYVDEEAKKAEEKRKAAARENGRPGGGSSAPQSTEDRRSDERVRRSDADFYGEWRRHGFSNDWIEKHGRRPL